MKILLVLFLLVNALFWGLGSHINHCKVTEWFGISPENCPPHYIHLLIGNVFFLLTIYVQQKQYFDNLY